MEAIETAFLKPFYRPSAGRWAARQALGAVVSRVRALPEHPGRSRDHEQDRKGAEDQQRQRERVGVPGVSCRVRRRYRRSSWAASSARARRSPSSRSSSSRSWWSSRSSWWSSTRRPWCSGCCARAGPTSPRCGRLPRGEDVVLGARVDHAGRSAGARSPAGSTAAGRSCRSSRRTSRSGASSSTGSCRPPWHPSRAQQEALRGEERRRGQREAARERRKFTESSWQGNVSGGDGDESSGRAYASGCGCVRRLLAEPDTVRREW